MNFLKKMAPWLKDAQSPSMVPDRHPPRPSDQPLHEGQVRLMLSVETVKNGKPHWHEVHCTISDEELKTLRVEDISWRFVQPMVSAVFTLFSGYRR